MSLAADGGVEPAFSLAGDDGDKACGVEDAVKAGVVVVTASVLLGPVGADEPPVVPSPSTIPGTPAADVVAALVGRQTLLMVGRLSFATLSMLTASTDQHHQQKAGKGRAYCFPKRCCSNWSPPTGIGR